MRSKHFFHHFKDLETLMDPTCSKMRHMADETINLVFGG